MLRQMVWVRLSALVMLGLCAATVARTEPVAPDRDPLRPLGPASQFRAMPPAAWGPIEFRRAEPPGPPPPLPDTHPARAGKGRAPEPVVAREDTQQIAPAQTQWEAGEIAKAKEACTQLLASTHVEYAPAEPMKEGSCGTPAPISVSSIGSNPKIALTPPPVMTCTLAASLDKWARETVQGKAKTHLKSQVVKLRNASGYTCRNRYGARNGILSEHARANAFDVAAFELASGDVVTIVDDWRRMGGVNTGSGPELPWRNPLRAAVSAMAGGNAPKALFLREVHEGACPVFGTVLGPAANAAHRDHFHFDMAERRSGNYCR